MFGRRLPEAIAALEGKPIAFARLDGDQEAQKAEAQEVATQGLQGASSQEADGQRAQEAQEAAPQEDWLAVYAEHLAVIAGGQVEVRHWFEFEGASWRDATRTLRLTFVDASIPPFMLVLAEGEKERIALIVRERIEQSIVFQEHAELPSGRAARGMVRRDGQDLFIQVLIDGEPEAADEVRLAELEASLRDVVGLSQ